MCVVLGGAALVGGCEERHRTRSSFNAVRVGPVLEKERVLDTLGRTGGGLGVVGGNCPTVSTIRYQPIPPSSATVDL